MEDRQLLQRFVKDHSQEAFAALTARYLNLVYAVCRREMGDADAAEDVTQAVFLILARKAPSLGQNVVLSGWLFQTARFAAKNARLTAQRRAAYEQKAAEALMEQQTETEDEQWVEIEPLLNQSLAALKPGDRDCLLLRFFQNASFAEVGASLGLSEDAARKRVTRSLKKMRQFFSKNGVIVPALALPVLLAAHAAKAAPAACQASIAKLIPGVLTGHTTAALTGSHAYQLSEGTLKAMKLAQIKLAVSITTAGVIGFGFYAASRAVTVTASHPAALLLNVPKPGHVFQQVPGSPLTAGEIADHCRQAYAALQSYECTANVTQTMTLPAVYAGPHTEERTALIQYKQQRKIHAQGNDANGIPWAYTSDGTGTEQNKQLSGWQKVSSQFMGVKADPSEWAISTSSVLSDNAGTTIPAVLLWSAKHGPASDAFLPIPGELFRGGDTEVREDTADGRLCYILTGHLIAPKFTQAESVWIDEKTFLIHRIVTDSANPATTTPFLPIPVAAGTTHTEQRYTNERINQPIPDSTFALPAVQ